ncbi:MAG: serine/threonine-protein phosphatase [Deltaproteobacteria bacterium]|jgi:serine phosphatase RsbU (regulator of sigma subunit)|nr:serine/threonine-protein phosphatase [Deltaproteobacteria bacterium]
MNFRVAIVLFSALGASLAVFLLNRADRAELYLEDREAERENLRVLVTMVVGELDILSEIKTAFSGDSPPAESPPAESPFAAESSAPAETSPNDSPARAGAGILEALRDSLNRRFPKGESAGVLILGADGRVLLHAGPKLDETLPELLSALGVWEKVRGSGSFEGELKNPDGDGGYVFRAELFRPLGWFVCAALKLKDLGAPLRSARQRMDKSALLAALVSAFLIFFFGGSGLSSRSSGSPAARFRDDPVADKLWFMKRTGLARLKMARARREAKRAAGGTEEEMKSAGNIQRALLPKLPPPSPADPFEVYGLVEPAGEVGGDFYYFFSIRLGVQVLILGDVADKGVPAALYAAAAGYFLKSSFFERKNAAEALEDLDLRLMENNPESVFMTVFAATVDLGTGVLEYASAGHPRPLVLNKNGAAELGDSGADPPAGVGRGLKRSLRRAALEEGDLILLYSDGASEAGNPEGGFFGRKNLIRLADELMKSGSDFGPREIVEGIFRALKEFGGGGGFRDDVALLAFRVNRMEREREGKEDL